MSTGAFPVATAPEVRAYARRLTLRYPRELAAALLLHILATVSGLATPRLLGDLVEDVRNGVDTIDRVILLIFGFILLQAVLIRFAMYASARLGEKVLAELREEFVAGVLSLPLATVERAGSGELVTRTTRDVDVLSRTVRLAVPDSLISGSTVLLTVGALALVDPWLVLPCLVAVPVLWVSTRWYLNRARAGYLRANASYSELTEGLTETVEGAQTVEAFRLADRRFARVNHDIAASYTAERYTLNLRSVYLPIADTGYILPVVATLVIGGLFYINGMVTLAAATAATLYVLQILEPVDRLLFWMDELQVGGASMARLLGVNKPSPDRHSGATGSGVRPSTGPYDIAVKGVSYAYRAGHDVLRDIDLDIQQGERLAIVGPSGAGKSTLGRLLAGIHPPRTGSLTIGGVVLAELPLGELRRQVALVTQEHHVFRGSVRDNLLIAKPGATDAELQKALVVVDAWDWVAELGLDLEVGSGAKHVTPGQAQQLALARLVLADPHTLILDEATSLLDPRAARHLERSLAAVLAGRTVIAIAHRLHTAHDAGRIVVMEDGRIRELGSHQELVNKGGVYAALWASWRGQAVGHDVGHDVGRTVGHAVGPTVSPAAGQAVGPTSGTPTSGS